MTPEPLDIEDPASLVAYLRAEGRIGADEPTPRVRVLAGGVSNKTVLVERASGEAWVLKQALHKLRVQADWFSDPARIHREAEALRWLPKLAPPGTITPLVFEDPPRHVLAMQAVPQPHENWKTMLMEGRVAHQRHVFPFAVILATIHRTAADMADEVRPAFEDRSFFESLRVEPYYTYTAARVREASPFLHALVRDTRAQQISLVHGDYSPKNMLVCADRPFMEALVLLDHEVIHWGDPSFDVGFALAHLLSKMHHVRPHRDRLLDAARTFYQWYGIKVGPALWDGEAQAMAGRHLLACLLARVAGRSPLEYLTDAERRAQQVLAVRGMRDADRPIGELVEWIATEGFEHADN